MKTRCPHCSTVYRIDPEKVKGAQGMARCFKCGERFNTFDNQEMGRDSKPPKLRDQHETHIKQEKSSSAKKAAKQVPKKERPLKIVPEKVVEEPVSPSSAMSEDLDSKPVDVASIASEPFNDSEPLTTSEEKTTLDVPSDMSPLEASNDVAIDLQETLEPTKRKTPWTHRILLWLLLLAVSGQFVWMYRVDVFNHPYAEPLCQQAWFDCSFAEPRDPKAFLVLEREMEPHPNVPDALYLNMRFANMAEFAQRFPVVQLSLFDSNEVLLAQRRLSPDQYLEAGVDPGLKMPPQEVFTINLLFEDPGLRASGFQIDFL